MKIRGTCRRCGREFFFQQAVEAGGRCPWDGEPFQPDYAAVLVDAMRGAQTAANDLENALEKLADIAPAFSLDRESVIAKVRSHLDRLERATG